MKNFNLISGWIISVLLLISCKKDILTTPITAGDNMAKNQSVAATGIVYFVSPSGNDLNNGTSSSTPWQTIQKVNAQNFVPGDQVLFEGGKVFTGNLTVNCSGVSGSYIKFASYGAGKAYINGGSGTGVYIYNNAYIWINNLVIYGAWNAGTQSGNTGYGILYYNDMPNAVKLGTAYVSSCDISGFKKAGIGCIAYPADNSQSGYTNLTFGWNIVHDNGDAGIVAYGPPAAFGSTLYAFPYVYVGGNKVYNNLGVKSITTSHSGDGILIGGASRGVVEKNVAYNNGWYNAATAGGPAAIWCYDSNNITFQYNEAHHNGTGAGKPDGDGFDLDGGATNCIMQYNYSHDNYAAGFLVWEYGNSRVSNSGNIIRYNISQNDNTGTSYYGAITMGSNCSSNSIYNNTIYTSRGSCLMLYGGTNNQFYNNIFYAAQSGAPIISTNTNTCWFFNNEYYNPGGFKIKFNGTLFYSLANFRATNNEIFNGLNYGFNTDPKLSNPGNGGSINTGNPSILPNYDLTVSSPLINRGYNLPSWGLKVGNYDFRKATIPFNGAYDIGACEFH